MFVEEFFARPQARSQDLYIGRWLETVTACVMLLNQAYEYSSGNSCGTSSAKLMTAFLGCAIKIERVLGQFSKEIRAGTDR